MRLLAEFTKMLAEGSIASVSYIMPDAGKDRGDALCTR